MYCMVCGETLNEESLRRGTCPSCSMNIEEPGNNSWLIGHGTEQTSKPSCCTHVPAVHAARS
jgi:hypothetical protein